MKKYFLMLVVMFMPYQLLHAAEASTTGQVVSIVGQRVTIVDSAGAQLTFSVPGGVALAPGDKIRITYAPVGDALRATAVTKLSK